MEQQAASLLKSMLFPNVFPPFVLLLAITLLSDSIHEAKTISLGDGCVFCGAGTTAIAALRLKSRFIGIDIDPRAIEAAKANITLSLQFQIQEREIS
ncbi:MAG: DNA methyltransferase [Nitrososphaeraceae archaeon]